MISTLSFPSVCRELALPYFTLENNFWVLLAKSTGVTSILATPLFFFHDIGQVCFKCFMWFATIFGSVLALNCTTFFIVIYIDIIAVCIRSLVCLQFELICLPTNSDLSLPSFTVTITSTFWFQVFPRILEFYKIVKFARKKQETRKK